MGGIAWQSWHNWKFGQAWHCLLATHNQSVALEFVITHGLADICRARFAAEIQLAKSNNKISERSPLVACAPPHAPANR